MRRALRCVVVAALVAAGCSGGVSGSGDGGADAGQLELGRALRLDAFRDQGYWGRPCGLDGGLDGGPVYGSTFRMPLDGGALHYEVCPFSGEGLRVGDRVPTAPELASLRAALGGVVRSVAPACGADKPYLRLDVTLPSGPLVLADSFYACQALADRVYVDQLDPVFARLDALSAP